MTIARSQVQSGERINIRPGVSILSVLRHLNYRPWYAMAEFVDNSLQSFLEWAGEIRALDGNEAKLNVSIELDLSDEGRISIRDNASGIHAADYARAFRPAHIPPDRSGLSEFGMGMKSAACWFARKWRVRTSALGEEVERIVEFDINSIVEGGIEELRVGIKPAPPERHFTEIVLIGLHNKLQGRTVGKIKEHLASIYRVFIREGVLQLRFGPDILTYESPQILEAPYYKDRDGSPIRWLKELDLDLGLGLRATGFAALRQVASVSDAGFALFRRNRLITGSTKEGYRPESIFGKSNSYTYQRLFGELHLEGFEVSHTKDGFRWEENEEVFLELLKEELNSPPLPLLDQAEGYRARLNRQEVKRGAEVAAERTAETIRREVPQVFERQLEAPVDTTEPPTSLPNASAASIKVIDVELNGAKWQIVLELSDDPALGDWVEICDQVVPEGIALEPDTRRLGVRVALMHPFMERFAGTTAAAIEPLVRLAAAIALAETAARASGVMGVGTVRRNINDLLRNALSRP